MARLYSNENFPLPVVEELLRLGHDVLTLQETGKAGQGVTDEAVLAFVCAEGRALVTLNRKHFPLASPARQSFRYHCVYG